MLRRLSLLATRPVVMAFLTASLWAAAPNTFAQQRVDGAIQEFSTFTHTPHAPDEIKVFRDNELKGAHKVAISVFNVAFPNTNTFSASTSGNSGGWGTSHESNLETTLTGVDHNTQQRITDNAYALFVSQLKAAGYEVVDQSELATLAPEFAKWDAQPNFSQGRYGSYVAPTGRSLFFLQGDQAKRDISGAWGEQLSALRVLGNPQAFSRSPYIAHDGKVGIIAVTLVMDYGVYSTSGERRSFGGTSKVGFKPGLTIGAGNVADSGTLLEYWGLNSGGFPAQIYLQLPVRSEKPFWTDKGLEGDNVAVEGSNLQSYAIVADPVKFEAEANAVAAIAIPKLVKVMTDKR